MGSVVILRARSLQGMSFTRAACFSIGVGNDTMVMLGDMLEEIATFGVIMLVIALIGAMLEVVAGFCQESGQKESRQALQNVMTLAGLELALSLIDLYGNQIELAQGIKQIEEGIEHAGHLAKKKIDDAYSFDAFICAILSPVEQMKHTRPGAIQGNEIPYVIWTAAILGMWCLLCVIVMHCRFGGALSGELSDSLKTTDALDKNTGIELENFEMAFPMASFVSTMSAPGDEEFVVDDLRRHADSLRKLAAKLDGKFDKSLTLSLVTQMHNLADSVPLPPQAETSKASSCPPSWFVDSSERPGIDDD